MFIEAAIALFLLGALFGLSIGSLIEANRSSRHIAYYRGRSIRHLAQAEQARKPHLGTPYLPRDASAIVHEAVDYLVDTHSGSRRAELVADRENVVPMQVQTGRPA